MAATDSQPRPRNVYFSVFEVSLVDRELYKHGIRVRLQKQPFEILCILLERPGEIVSREELRERLWPENTFVEYEDSLNTAVRKLRAALSDSSDTPRYVETVARQGYRFIAPLLWQKGAQAASLKSESVPGEYLVGKRVGDFRVLQLLGGGGMGVVYKAEDLKLGRQVAIKFLPNELVSDPVARHRLRREAQAVSLLDHPNICPVYQLVELERESFLVMQLLDGQTLRDWIEASVDEPSETHLSRVLELAIEVAAGLDAAHQKGIIHRDIKPANVMVTNKGQAKILDFGVAKFLEPYQTAPEFQITAAKELVGMNPNLTQTGETMGTPSYLSPEQMRGEKLDPRSDLFSFGSLLCEMVTRRKAFLGNSGSLIRDAVLNEPVVPARQQNFSVPQELERIIGKALEKDRELRYQQASEIREDLRRLQQQLSFSTSAPIERSTNATLERPSPSDLRETQRRVQRRWALAAIGIFLSVILVVLLYRNRTVSRSAPTAGTSHRQLTFAGNAFMPAISPDGTLVAFVVRNAGEEQKLMVQGVDGPAIEAAHGVEIYGPQWAPDNSQLLFQESASDVGLSEVFSINRRRGDESPRLVTAGSTAACWSPDGSQIVTVLESLKMLKLTNGKTGEAKRIPLPRFTFLKSLDSSPSAGLILAAVLVDNKNEIWTFRPDGTDFRTVKEEAVEIQSPRWVGHWIYYLRPNGNTSDLVRISGTGEEKASRVASGLQAGNFFTISADGSRVVYTREDHSANLWRVDMTHTGGVEINELKRLTSGTGYYGEPSFSPDGRWIAFAFGSSAAETNIYRMLSTGGDPVQLTFAGHALMNSPAWSPDRQHIAFISNQSGTPKVWVVSASGDPAQILDLTNASDTNNYLTWYPNRNIVYQKPGVQTYLQVSNSGQDEQTIVHPDANAWLFSKPSFSRDESKLAALWNRSGLGLWVISLSPYSEKLLHAGEIYPFGWSSDGKYLYGLRGPDGGREIVRIELQHPEKLLKIANLPGQANGATLSPVANEAVVSIAELKSDVWLMDNFDTAF